MHGGESWPKSNNLMYELEDADKKVLRMIIGMSRRNQWEFYCGFG